MIQCSRLLAQQKMEFENNAVLLLLNNSFKKSKELYWRVVDGKIFQCVALVKTGGTYNIFFDMIPMYEKCLKLDLGCRAREIPLLNVQYATERGTFSEQIEYFCTHVVPEFSRVVTDEELYAFHKEWIKKEAAYCNSNMEESERFEENELEGIFNEIMLREYSFAKKNPNTWLNDHGIYAALKCKDYETVVDEFSAQYYYRCSGEVFRFKKGEASLADLKNGLETIDDIFFQEKEIMQAIAQGEHANIESILSENLRNNIVSLNKILGCTII